MAKKQKNQRMFDFETFEVSQVPQGQNKRKFLLLKEQTPLEEENMDEMLEKILKADLKDEDQIDAKIDEILPEEIKKDSDKAGNVRAALKGAMRLLGSVKADLPGGGKRLVDQLAGLMGEKKAASKEDLSDEMKQKVKKAEAVIAEAAKIEKTKKEAGDGKEGDVIPKETQAKLDELFESSAKITKENEALSESNKTLTEQIGKEREMRVTKEFVEKAKSFGHVGEGAEKLGKTLKEASETMSKEGYEGLEKTLKAANAKIEAGSIFTEVGTSNGGSASYESKMKVAKEAIRKEDPKLSDAQAEATALERNPGLYDEYLGDNPQQVGGQR